MKPADRAWIAAAITVTAYEITAVKLRWELLSEAVDRYRRQHPIATDCCIGFVALHLLRRWPPRIDPLAALANLFR
ncbi:MAG: hypothetical protein KC491_01025 [Dehalococcoidia bacterium]|nr:hypothetical protein [Dehalococcoidia bacterium]